MPKPFTPRPWQPLMSGHVLTHKRSALFVPMGMGKSGATLNALHDLQLVEPDPILITAPLRVAESTWPEEVAKWSQFAGAFDVTPIIGDGKTRAAALDRAQRVGGIATINYENLPWLVERLETQKRRWPFKTVVADELSKLKGFRSRQGTQRAKALASVAHKHVDRFIGLTGTPSPNGLSDLWGQCWFLDGGERLGRTFTAFTQRWFRPTFNGFGIEPLPFAHDEIHERIKDVCLSLNAADWFDLKEPVRNVVQIELPAKARAAYRDMEKQFFAEVDGHEVEAFNAASKSMKLLQFTSGAAYVDETRERWADIHDAKLVALESVIEEAGGMPVLVLYHFKSSLARLTKAFPGALNVGTSAGLAEAKKGKGKVWLGHPASMGHGVDGLQYHSNIACFFDLNWNLEEHMQAIERIGPTRQMQAGKDRAVFVHYLVAKDSIDEIVMERLTTKREVQDLLLDALKRRS